MNPEKKIQIRVNTDVLRELLDQNPEAKLELEAFAAEKVAQELVRKFIDKREADIRILLKSQIDGLITKPKWTTSELTEIAKQLIDVEVDRAIARRVGIRGKELDERVAESAEESVRARLNKIVVQEREEREAFMKRLQTWWAEGSEKLEDAVKKIARDEFMKVIAEVSGVFTPKKEG